MEMPVTVMKGHSFEEAADAFKRINKQGVKLSKSDLESAAIAAKHSGFIKNAVTPFMRKLPSLGLERLFVQHLFQGAKAIAGLRPRDKLTGLTPSEIRDAWRRLERSVDRTRDIIQSELQLSDMSFLWSGSLLVPLIVICATHNPSNSNARRMAAWVALAAVGHRYSGSSETALIEDLKACATTDPISALIRNARRELGARYADEHDFDAHLQDRGIVLAAYIASLQLGAKDFLTNQTICSNARSSTVARHHIFPRSAFPKKQRREADVIGNLAFLKHPSNEELLARPPHSYLPSVRDDVKRSQAIPLDKKLWTDEYREDFWRYRRRLLAKAFNDFVRERENG
jgi:hypothetical protein